MPSENTVSRLAVLVLEGRRVEQSKTADNCIGIVSGAPPAKAQSKVGGSQGEVIGATSVLSQPSQAGGVKSAES